MVTAAVVVWCAVSGAFCDVRGWDGVVSCSGLDRVCLAYSGVRIYSRSLAST